MKSEFAAIEDASRRGEEDQFRRRIELNDASIGLLREIALMENSIQS